MKKVIKYIGFGLLVTLTFVVLTLLILSPQSTPSINAVNSIAIVEDVELNGVLQRIVIRGENLDNPILLHLHGGPGSPDHAFWKDAGLNIEDLFNVVYWDQRGAGASYHKDIDPSSMTINQLSDDGIALSRILLKRFSKDKIYLQGHSFGTAVATYMAQKSPNLYHGYIGIGQVANKLLAEQRSYDFALTEATKVNNKEHMSALNKIGRPPYVNDSMTLQAVFVERPIMRTYENPYASDPMSMLDIYKLFAAYNEYSIGDKLSAIKGDLFSMKHLWTEIRDSNFANQFPSWRIPVYFVQGKYDQHTVTTVAKEYFDVIEAPKKEFFEFERSAHNPHIEEQEKYREALKEILQSTLK